MTVTTTKKQLTRTYNNWQPTDVVTHNDVINAYFKGKEDGRTEKERVYQSLFDSNLEKAKSISEALFDRITKSGIRLKAIHLKADEITNFAALFVSDKEDFLKDEFRNVFVMARESKSKNEENTFNISFVFTPDSKTLDEHCLASDGYFIKYYGEK